MMKKKDFWSIGNIKYIPKLAQDDGKENDVHKANVMPLHLSACVISNIKKIMMIFVGFFLDINKLMYTMEIRIVCILKISIGNCLINWVELGKTSFKAETTLKLEVFGMLYF